MLEEAAKEHPPGTGYVILPAVLNLLGVGEGLRGENPPSEIPFCMDLSPARAMNLSLM